MQMIDSLLNDDYIFLLEEEWNITKDFRYFKAWMRICICECFEIRKEYYEYVLQK